MAANFNNLTEFYNAVSNVDSISAMISSLGEIDVATFSYEGFDATKILANIYALAKTTEVKTISKDIVDLVVIGLTRGNVREDQIDKTSAAGKARIKELITKYNVPTRKSRTERTNLKPDTITFVRCVNVFPMIASILIHKQPIIANRIQLSGELGSNFCPVELKHTGAAGMIPKSDVGNTYLLAQVVYMLELGDLIDPKAKNKTLKQRFDEQKRYAMAAYNSNLISPVAKLAVFKALNLDSRVNILNALRAYNVLRHKMSEGQIAETVLDRHITADKVVISGDVTLNTAADQMAAKMVQNFTIKTSEIASSSTSSPVQSNLPTL